MPRFRSPSPAMCVALLGLFVALGGTTWAAVSLPAHSVGAAQLKRNAVTGEKVKDHSLTGADIRLASLGTVPAAAHATSADSATHAASADLAAHATAADAAGSAFSTHFETGIAVPAVATAVASLHVPAGSYVLAAKGQVDTQTASAIVECDLVAGSDKDVGFVQGGASHQSQILVNSLVHVAPAAETVSLMCAGFLSSGTLSQVRLTAVQVGSVSSQP
jgi:hypothetical protein